MNDGFANNPFQALAGQLHVADKSQKRPKASEKKSSVNWQKREEAKGQDLRDNEDQALFLRAVGRLERQKPCARKAPLVTFGEQCHELTPKKQCARPKTLQRKSDEKRRRINDRTLSQKETLEAQGSEASAAETRQKAVMDESEFTEKEWQSFLKAVDGVEPLNEQRGRIVRPENKPQTAAPVSCDFASMLESRLEFQLFCRDEYLEGQIAGLDQLIMDKLRSGNFSPEAHLDLHGFTVVQAFEALRGFIKSSWYKGLRNLLIIPGRGRNSLDGVAVLRSKLPHWFTQEPLKRVVLAFCTAKPADGGPGSIYVLLRKYRKKGRVFWERLPMDEELF
ncbi:MAG: Smr/MutS family protein [Desulfovibrio sp.]|nr:Smr/MutS family protein [Desulfovibrio sp.]